MQNRTQTMRFIHEPSADTQKLVREFSSPESAGDVYKSLIPSSASLTVDEGGLILRYNLNGNNKITALNPGSYANELDSQEVTFALLKAFDVPLNCPVALLEIKIKTLIAAILDEGVKDIGVVEKKITEVQENIPHMQFVIKVGDTVETLPHPIVQMRDCSVSVEVPSALEVGKKAVLVYKYTALDEFGQEAVYLSVEPSPGRNLVQNSTRRDPFEKLPLSDKAVAAAATAAAAAAAQSIAPPRPTAAKPTFLSPEMKTLKEVIEGMENILKQPENMNLDELNELSINGQQIVSDLQGKEKERSDGGGHYSWVSTPGTEESQLKFRWAQALDKAKAKLRPPKSTI